MTLDSRHSCPDLLRAVEWWLAVRRGLDSSCREMWRLPWEGSKFGGKQLVEVFRRAVSRLGHSPPPGFRWTLHCVRAGAASEANALDIAMSKIRRQGDWGPKSDVPMQYIDIHCPPSGGRRFFGWLKADPSTLGASTARP